MKKNTQTLLGLSLCALAIPTLAQEPAPIPEAMPEPAAQQETPAISDAEMKQVISYFLGFQTGQQFASDGSGPMYMDDLDKEIFMQAVEDGLKGQVNPEIEKKDLRACISAFVAKLDARGKEIGEKNAAEAKAFLDENGKKEGVVTTESGLQYKVLTPSEGRKFDSEKDGNVNVTYEGRLLDGTVFDKSDEPISFSVDGVIPGFSEALKLMPIGSEWEVYIPSELAYGDRGPGGSNSMLIFKVKLHDIAPKQTGKPDAPFELTPELIKQLEAAGMQPVQQ